MNKTLLIIVPTYNAEPFIKNTLDSLLNQTYQKLKICIINDCCTDNTMEIVKSYNSNKITIYNNDRNIGTYQSINKVLNSETGYNYFFIHGADDVSAPHRFEHMMNVFKEDTLASMDCYHVIQFGTYIPITNNPQGKHGHSMLCYKKIVFDTLGYFDNTRYGGDTEYYERFKAQFGTKHIQYINSLNTTVICHTNSLTHTICINSDKRQEYVNKFTVEHKQMKLNKSYYRPYKQDLLISANVAALPDRVHLLPQVVDSILPQVDVLRIYLNGFKSVPKFLKNNSKIEYYLNKTNIGDRGKFYWSMNPNEYYFSIDDDLLYPPTYVKDHLELLNKYNDEVIVTLHGRIMKTPMTDYYRDYIKAFRCLGNVDEDTFTNNGGTGVMCFNTNKFKVDFNELIYPNMADCFVSKFAQEQNFPIIVRKHETGYLGYLIPDNDIPTIYEEFAKTNRALQNSIINSITDWKILIHPKAIKPEIKKESVIINSEEKNEPINFFTPRVIKVEEKKEQEHKPVIKHHHHEDGGIHF